MTKENNVNIALDVHKAFNQSGNMIDSSNVLLALNASIRDIYRYLEPSHFCGELIICKTLDDSDILNGKPRSVHYDNNFLINCSAEQLIIQVKNDAVLHKVSTVCDKNELFQNNNAIFYYYANHSEYYHANGIDIPIKKTNCAASMFAPQFDELSKALEEYMLNDAMYSSCSILKNIWYDDKRIFLQGGAKDLPEKHMQDSLAQYLRHKIRGMKPVVREYNLGGSKPVDICVRWSEANRVALIEIKWLGQSCDDAGAFTTSYSPSRVKDGSQQLKEYLDLERSDTPASITKGFLVVFNARRKGLKEGMKQIGYTNGKYYANEDLSSYYGAYVNDVYNFEKPHIVFLEPICEAGID